MEYVISIFMEISKWAGQGRAFQAEGTTWEKFGARDSRGLWRTRIKERERIRARTQETSLARLSVTLVSLWVLRVCLMRMYLETVTC